MLKKSIICALMVGVVVFAFASKGGGDKKKTASLLKSFTPIRTSNGFTLRAGPSYTGSMILSSQHDRHFVLFNSVVTYQKGNTIYILPYRYKINTEQNQNCFHSNLQLLDLKIRLHK